MLAGMHPYNRTSTTFWQVVIHSECQTYNGKPEYVWVATGPRGCNCGVEHTALAAETSARAASYLLAEPTRRDGEAVL